MDLKIYSAVFAAHGDRICRVCSIKVVAKNTVDAMNFIAKRKGAKVFCVSCGAQRRTLRKWHNSYLCTDCYKIMQNVGEDHFIKSLKGEEV